MMLDYKDLCDHKDLSDFSLTVVIRTGVCNCLHVRTVLDVHYSLVHVATIRPLHGPLYSRHQYIACVKMTIVLKTDTHV